MPEYGDGRKTYSLRDRKNKVSWTNFADPATSGRSVSELVDGLPHILAGQDFRRVIVAIAKAYREQRPVIAMLGGHVIKCGLSPVINSLIERKIITAIAMNGAASIHDFEIALIGYTSEDVEENLAQGKFGMWEETGRLMNEAINKRNVKVSFRDSRADSKEVGMGVALARKLLKIPIYVQGSIMLTAYQMNIPITVHVAIGTDIIHQHPIANGAAIGASTFRDFEIFTKEVSGLGDGGVLLNFGSAVILPEIFLKALNIARNVGHRVSNFTTANFDMISQYRAVKNVVERPGGDGYNIIGHHEIMIPLLACAVLDYIEMMDYIERGKD